MRARLCRLALQPGTCRWCACLCNGAAIKASTDQASKLAAAPRCEAEADSSCVLVFAAWHSNQAPAGVLAFATEPPLELILIEQACGCSSVQGGGKILLVPLVSTA